MIATTFLSRLSGFVADKMGLHFPKERWHDLERGIVSATRDFEFEDPGACIEWLLSSPLSRNQIEILASHLTVGETYFFRERRSFEILEGQILPGLIHSQQGADRHLRIWSAGCCTGEEPYSIAILLSRMIPDLRDWRVTILATDINPCFLQKGREGIYNEWSFRDTPSWIRERYFKKREDGRLEILPDIKRMVTFSYLNLAEDAYPSLLNNTTAMDLIFCRNVLIYFTQDRTKRVIRNLYCSIMNGGWLIVGPSETSQLLSSQFTIVNLQDAILYRKQGSRFRVQGSKENSQSLISVPCSPTPDSILPPVDLDPEHRSTANIKEDTYAKAQVLYEQGCYDETIKEIMGLVAQDKTDSKAISLLSRAYANQGRLPEALIWSEKAIASDKLNPGLYYLRAMILQEQGMIDEAILSLRRALYLDQELVLAHFAIGSLLMRQGRSRESGRYFRNALILLHGYWPEEVLPESDGITAGRLTEIIGTVMHREMAA